MLGIVPVSIIDVYPEVPFKNETIRIFSVIVWNIITIFFALMLIGSIIVEIGSIYKRAALDC